ncbi:hypothetical protein Kim5_CH02895 [Rhizobium sp. Kim5]|nr:hypothetical protein Kim5_CH02895 [Rhizobium sp. Kim5]
MPSVPGLHEHAILVTVGFPVATSCFSRSVAWFPSAASREHWGSCVSGVLKPTSLTGVPSLILIVSPSVIENAWLWNSDDAAAVSKLPNPNACSPWVTA